MLGGSGIFRSPGRRNFPKAVPNDRPRSCHTMPATALLPASMVAIFGKRQRRRTLEELAR
jgi:hypothetical protein